MIGGVEKVQLLGWKLLEDRGGEINLTAKNGRKKWQFFEDAAKPRHATRDTRHAGSGVPVPSLPPTLSKTPRIYDINNPPVAIILDSRH